MRVVIDYFNINSSLFPHGMTIDEDGNLWLVLYKGGRIDQINPTLEILKSFHSVWNLMKFIL